MYEFLFSAPFIRFLFFVFYRQLYRYINYIHEHVLIGKYIDKDAKKPVVVIWKKNIVLKTVTVFYIFDSIQKICLMLKC